MSSPYRFLDYFEEEHQGLFFGRNTEIEILLADVIVSRLVVLYAKTGLGKTSLINAGVRPRLRKLAYRPFYVRVERDPILSLRTTLQHELNLKFSREVTLIDLLKALKEQITTPIVIFFDQFEEFFMYIVPQQPQRAREFIKEVADLYHDTSLKVHLVFSLREDFFGEMDMFRDSIPSIFQKDSNLRLLPLTARQARQAITGPAKSLFKIDEEQLITKLLSDLDALSEEEGIQPAHLQIVCDTLWQKSDGLSITSKLYDELGGAQSIWNSRLQADLAAAKLSYEELLLLPELINRLTDRKRDTKVVRGLAELEQDDVFVKHQQLFRNLISKLKERRFIRERRLEREVYIEWVTDYLAKNVYILEEALQSITAIQLLTKLKEELSKPLEQRLETDTRLAQDFLELSKSINRLPLDRDDAESMFNAALQYGIEMLIWFETADEYGVPVWAILDNVIKNPDADLEMASNSIHLLPNLPDKRARDLLLVALAQKNLAEQAVVILAQHESDLAVELLQTILFKEPLLGVLIRSLQPSSTSVDLLDNIARRKTIDSHSLSAGRKLYQISLRSGREAARYAKSRFSKLMADYSFTFFLEALKSGEDAHLWFVQAAEQGVTIWDELSDMLEGDADEVAENAIALLGQIGNEQAIQLLAGIRNESRTALAAATLDELIKFFSTNISAARAEQRDVAALKSTKEINESDQELAHHINEQDALRSLAQKAREVLSKLVSEPHQSRREHKQQSSDYSSLTERDWQFLLRSIQSGECTPIVGTGATIGTLPLTSQIAQTWAADFNYPVEESVDLVRVSQFLATTYDPLFPKEQLFRRWFKDAKLPDFSRTDDLHSVLARLPLSLYITTNYDDLMAQALKFHGKQSRSEIARWNSYLRDELRSAGDHLNDEEPTVSSPAIFHLHGHINTPESLVLTEDDYIDFTMSLARDDLLPNTVRWALARTTLLVIGYNMRDLNFRTLHRSLLINERNVRSISTIGVQPITTSDDQSYLNKYFDNNKIRPFWGTIQDFVRELWERWQVFSKL